MPAREGGEDARVQAEDPHRRCSPARWRCGSCPASRPASPNVSPLWRTFSATSSPLAASFNTRAEPNVSTKNASAVVALLDDRGAERKLELVEALGDEAADALVEEARMPAPWRGTRRPRRRRPQRCSCHSTRPSRRPLDGTLDERRLGPFAQPRVGRQRLRCVRRPRRAPRPRRSEAARRALRPGRRGAARSATARGRRGRRSGATPSARQSAATSASSRPSMRTHIAASRAAPASSSSSRSSSSLVQSSPRRAISRSTPAADFAPSRATAAAATIALDRRASLVAELVRS